MSPLLVPPPSFKIGENLNTVKYGFSPSKSVQGRRLFPCMGYIVMPTPSVPFKCRFSINLSNQDSGLLEFFFPIFYPHLKKKGM
jgi:hypothetical protein